MASALSRSEFFSNLPPPAECLAILLGCAECIVFGLGGISSPLDYSRGYGVPIDAPPEGVEPTENQRTQKALVLALAARHVQNGALILTLACYTRDRTALGLAVAYGVVSTLADSLIVKSYGVHHLAGGHMVAVMNSLVIGGSLLYWRRDDKLW